MISLFAIEPKKEGAKAKAPEQITNKKAPN
jgi:hypothetical protein